MQFNLHLVKSLIPTSRTALILSAVLLSAPTLMAQTIGAPISDKASAIAALKASNRSPGAFQPNALGDFSRDNVYTAITPCRIVDTRIAGGAFPSNAIRTYDVDGPNLIGQGGSATGCGIPFGVAASVAMTITVTSPAGGGYISAWGLGVQPFSSVVNHIANETAANTTIVPVVPGVGPDFSIFSSAGNPQVIIDVVGYFAAPTGGGLMQLGQLAGNWSVTLSGFNGCGNVAIQYVGTTGNNGLGTGTLTQHGSCGNSVVNNVNFNITSLNGNGSGTANLSCGVGCGYNLRIQVSPDRNVMNVVDVDPANPGNYLGGAGVRF